MTNATQPNPGLSHTATPREPQAKNWAPRFDRFRPFSQVLREWWGDLVALASIGVCVWFLVKAAMQLWR
jgi:hypothetical protein